VIDSILSQDYSFPSSVPISLELKHLINELFNPDHLHRIRMSEIMLHPWCCNETHDMGRKNEIKKPLHRSVVTLSVGREFSKIAANKLSGGPSKLGNLMAGPSKLGNLGKLNAGLSTLRVSNIDQIMKLSLPDSPNKELCN
jgi:serine/threonine protein kinase